MSLPKICTCPTVPYADCPFHYEDARGELAAMSCSVTQEMVKAALDEYVQYTIPVSSIETPYRVDLQNALQGIAAHINKSLNS